MPAPEWVKGRLQPEPAVSKFIYNTFFKRSSSYMASIIVFSLGFGIAYDKIMNTIWDMNNKGVGAAAAHRPRCRRAEPRAPALPLAETMEGHQAPVRGGGRRLETGRGGARRYWLEGGGGCCRRRLACSARPGC